MSTATARLLFVFVLVINVLLWSNSRYGSPAAYRSLHAGERSLVKRISYDLMHAGEAQVSGSDECRPITEPPALQCTHVEEKCPPASTFLSIDYLHYYFCASPALRPLVFTALVVWLIFLFSTLGISASDFFTPNLASIAQLLGLDENVAGVTFLAFGNGSPDLFSTLSAMRANSGSLAIGELLGAATFIVSCVVGSMCIIKPFRVHRGPFLRDVGFFTIAVGLVLVILYDSEILMVEAVLLVGLYVLYATIVIVGSWWENRQERIRERENVIRNEYREGTQVFPPYRDDPSPSASPENGLLTIASPIPSRTRAISTPVPPRLQTSLPPRPHSRTPSPTPRISQLPSFSLVGALEFRDVIAGLQREATGSSLNMFESPVTPYAGGHYHHRPRSLSRAHSLHGLSPRSSWRADEENGEPIPSLPLDHRRSRPSIVVTPGVPEEPDEPQEPLDGDYFSDLQSVEDTSRAPVPSIYRTPASPSLSGSEEQLFVPQTKRQRVWRIIKHIAHTLFPTLHHFRDQKLLGKIASLFAAPAVMLLTLTLPIVVTQYESSRRSVERKLQSESEGQLVDFEEEGVERVLVAEEEVEENLHGMAFNKWLMAAQCVFGPLFCAGVLFKGTKYEAWILIGTAIAGFAIGTLVLIFANNDNNLTARMVRCSMGFLVAIVWIMAIADEVVNVLQTFGHIFGLSEAIIGLTIFAMGNSLADLVANMSVAAFAPIMGFSACFGGPMLNILLGIGLSGSYIIHTTQKPYYINLSPTLLVSVIGLLILLAATLIVVPLNDYHLTRRWGILLIISYLVIMIINVVVEVKHLGE